MTFEYVYLLLFDGESKNMEVFTFLPAGYWKKPFPDSQQGDFFYLFYSNKGYSKFFV